MADVLEPQTPEWWIARLWKELDDRAARIQLYDDYYDGEQRLQFASQKARETFGDTFRGVAVNFCALIVNALEERLGIRGFRVADGAQMDPAAEVIWESNDMDAQASMVHIEALTNEEGYLLVWLDAERRQAVITAESPFEMYVERPSSAPSRRTAALKRWLDDDKHWMAVLYLPDALWKFRSIDPIREGQGSTDAVRKPGFWAPLDVEGEAWPLPNPLGVVPVVPVTNQPRLGRHRCGTSELKAAIPIQDIINKTAFDELIASEFVAYPQRYMVGVTLPTDENDQPIEPFKAGADRVWFVQLADGKTSINPQIGQFPQADLRPYVDRIDAYITRLASITMTPKHYLIETGGGTNLSGDTVKALEAPLASKAKRRQDVFGVAWAEVMALAMRLEQGGAYEPADAKRIEVDWKDPETRTESQHIDALQKLKALGVPDEQLQRDAGYTEDQIARFKAMREAEPKPPAPAPMPTGAPPVPGSPVAMPPAAGEPPVPA